VRAPKRSRRRTRRRALEHILADAALLQEFADEGEADFSYEIRGLSRFRVDAFRQRGWVSIACRAIPFQVRTIESIRRRRARISEVISEGSYYGMQTFDQALLHHVTSGNITEETALEVASSAHDFKLMLSAEGQRASGIEQVIGDDEAPEDSLQFVKR
jgi:Tfp pilus assembly pilus retraction ATPase PilT